MERKENEGKVTNPKEIQEQTHVRNLGDGKVELTHGVDKCIRKVHELPECYRSEE